MSPSSPTLHSEESASRSISWRSHFNIAARAAFRHVKTHTGVGLICAVAYFDPGNWSVDLQAGSQFGYKLLFVVLLSALFAVLFQILASRLGCVTGIDLASHCRILLYDRPKYPRVFRWLALYPLYVLSEIAIISTDLAELLGSGIALSLLFPELPLWAGILLTACDVIFILALGDPLGGRPYRVFELLIIALVLAVLICMIVIIVRVSPNWSDAFDGFVPSKTLIQPGAFYTAIGIIGATVMPHGLFLGSALATQDRVSPRPLKSQYQDTNTTGRPVQYIKHSVNQFVAMPLQSVASAFRNVEVVERPARHSDRENNSLKFIHSHLTHGIIDISLSLLGFAVAINALILILAGAVFYYGSDNGPSSAPASLFDAFDLIRELVGRPASLLFALALLCAGQSASLTATIAGQTVSEGFINWKVSPVVRRLITRLIGLIPSMAVAIAVGPAGINAVLVASQVVLSIVLPFVVLPLIWLTSSKTIMCVRKGSQTIVHQDSNITAPSNTLESAMTDEMIDFSNGIIVTCIAYGIWLVLLVANVYLLVTLGLGQG